MTVAGQNGSRCARVRPLGAAEDHVGEEARVSYDVLLFLAPGEPQLWPGAVEGHLRALEEHPAEPGLVLDDCIERIAASLPESAWAGPPRGDTTETAALLGFTPDAALAVRDLLLEVSPTLRPFVAHDLQVDDFLVP